MADICAVCNEKMALLDVHVPEVGIEIHTNCQETFLKDPEKYGGKPIEKTEDQIKVEKDHNEQQKKEKEEFHKLQKVIKDTSVYVKGFRMPFGEMVTFIFKWTMASIPTAIFLAILFLIFTAIFA